MNNHPCSCRSKRAGSLLCRIAVCFLAGWLPAAYAGGVRYSVTKTADLGLYGPSAINNKGQMVGSAHDYRDSVFLF
jgi:hypothetical protein